MLQIDHIYEFLYQEIFKDFEVWHLVNGVPNTDNISISDTRIFTPSPDSEIKIFFYDQEPIMPNLTEEYIELFKFPVGYDLEDLYQLMLKNQAPYNLSAPSHEEHLLNLANPNRIYKEPNIFVTSEKSKLIDHYLEKYDMKGLYYFFHGFAALDWYRGYYPLNYNKPIVKSYLNDYITYNRIINNDRSYRIYFISQLKSQGILDKGLVSFGVTDDQHGDWRDEVVDPKTKLSDHARQHVEEHLTDINKLVIDHHEIHGSASADIPRTINGWWGVNAGPNIDALWHVVTETVFYYDKLHLTEKVFKPIVCKQPFMLLAAPGNLEYLRSYGFKTFDGIIDESYDTIIDNDARIEAVVKQLSWYCNLSEQEKTNVMRALEPIVSHNFHHFYGDFKQIISQELITNIKTLLQDIGYDDQHIDYTSIYQRLIK